MKVCKVERSFVQIVLTNYNSLRATNANLQFKKMDTVSGNNKSGLQKSDVLFEDNHIIIVNKKSSQLVQGDKTGDIPLLELVKSYIKKKYDKPGEVFLGLPHRLDRPVSGSVIFARTSKALTRITRMFAEKEIVKIYWAVVKKADIPESDTLKNYLVRNNEKNKSFAYDKEVPGAKYAELDYKIISASDNYFLLEILLKTGRHHQIRCQLAKIGIPIKGDLKYGFPRSNENAGIHLHARRVSFIHPVTKENIVVEAPLPDDVIWKMFEGVIESGN